MSARSRAGVTGNSRMRTLSGRNAASIAETMAAGAPMAPLSAALDPERIERRGRFHVVNFDWRDHVDGRQQIVREGDGEGLSAGIVMHPFQQGRTDPVHHGPVHLSL